MPRTVTMADAQVHFSQLIADKSTHPLRDEAAMCSAQAARIDRERAIEDIKAIRKRIGFSVTIEDIIAARDEGRR